MNVLYLFQEEIITAEIVYHLPDYPQLLQTFLWQSYDRPPDFPKLVRFLNFWHRSLDGPLHSVQFTRGPKRNLHRIEIVDDLLKLH